MNKKAVTWIFVGFFVVALANHYQSKRDIVRPSFGLNLDLVYLTVSSFKQQIDNH